MADDASVSVAVDFSAIDRVLEAPLKSWLQRKLSEVASYAFQIAPVSKETPIHPLSKRGIQQIPGTLKHSINTRITGGGTVLVGYVDANAPYAYYVHEGTKGGQSILPLRPAYALAFWSERDGDFVVTGHVTRGATPAQPFLRDALVAVIGG